MNSNLKCRLFLIFIFVTSGNIHARDPLPGSRFQQLTGIKTNSSSKTQWDEKYGRSGFVFGKSPAKFLSENYHYIPFEGTVLDMGMGEGRNAVFLAQKGYKVTGVDISSVAVKKSYLLAQEFGVKIKGIVASLEEYSINPNSFDAIICFYYVDRSLIKKMKTWLKPGGVIIYEAFTERELEKSNAVAKSNLLMQSQLAGSLDSKGKNLIQQSYLKEQELLHLFPEMRILKYEEPLHEKQFRSSIILRKDTTTSVKN